MEKEAKYILGIVVVVAIVGVVVLIVNMEKSVSFSSDLTGQADYGVKVINTGMTEEENACWEAYSMCIDACEAAAESATSTEREAFIKEKNTGMDISTDLDQWLDAGGAMGISTALQSELKCKKNCLQSLLQCLGTDEQ